MNTISKDIICWKLNNFLLLKDKIQLSRANKRFNMFEKKIINYHIGEIIANIIGISKCRMNEDMNLIKQEPFEFLKSIGNLLFYRKTKIIKKNYKYCLPLGTQYKINRLTLSECINSIKSNNIYVYKKNRRYSTYDVKTLRKKFINVYVLLLA
jgi:hypothetical protein